jgi:hypothetical protein
MVIKLMDSPWGCIYILWMDNFCNSLELVHLQKYKETLLTSYVLNNKYIPPLVTAEKWRGGKKKREIGLVSTLRINSSGLTQ